ncbi:hypothetical protein ACXA2G_003484, partial [Vibrio cholerae]
MFNGETMLVKNKTKFTQACSLDSFRDVEKWIAEMGFNFRNSRFGVAKKVYEHWHETSKVPSHEELWSLCELMDLLELYNHFSKENVDSQMIRRIMSGCNLLVDESDTTARNYLFEFKVASRFKRSGFTIIDDPDHDVVVEFEGNKLYIECKRFKNYKKMSERIKYAYETQLAPVEDRCQQSAIFLDFSRVVYQKFINSTEQPWTDMDVLSEWRDSYDFMLKEMLEENHSNILSDVKMCVIYYTFPAFIELDGIPKLIKFNHFATITANEDNVTRTILNSLRGSVGNI